jgi:hypothetical protein
MLHLPGLAHHRLALMSLSLACALYITPAHATSPSFPKPLRIVDSKGSVVGTVVSPESLSSGEATVIRRMTPTLFVTLQTAGGRLIAYPGGGQLFYESTDCSGRSYLPFNTANPLVRPTFVFPAYPQPPFPQILYPGDPLETKTLHSALSANGPSIQCEMSISDREVRPAETLAIDPSSFTPPFRVK